MSVSLLLVGAAFICTVASALGRCPLWVPVLLLCVNDLLGGLPIH